ncbi:hypothetical protein RF11_03156 [Thelohanellus kitauei]|uniref:Uncharacterized protein n=1 Tax=Thelohanellus kitauei TaxID=669202 RepID=A0A0C2JB40_THEKT|nr:hypothetical protein RF11_03156 [Thelohanellus kitauei]
MQAAIDCFVQSRADCLATGKKHSSLDAIVSQSQTSQFDNSKCQYGRTTPFLQQSVNRKQTATAERRTIVFSPELAPKRPNTQKMLLALEGNVGMSPPTSASQST